MPIPDMLERGSVADSEIDKVSANESKTASFKWEWLSATDQNGVYLSDNVRKLKENGLAWFTVCSCKIVITWYVSIFLE